jgi:hypothetical protein
MLVELNKKRYNALFSLIMLAFLASIIIFVFYPGKSELGQKFNVTAIFLLLRYIGLCIGICVIILRVIKVLNNNSALLYVFIGLLNTAIGLLSLILFITNNMDASALNLFILNEVIGAIILMDVMIFNSR